MKTAKKAAVVLATAGIAAGAAAGSAFASSEANGAAAHSPGVLSGNVGQVPVHIPIIVAGDSVNVIGLLNPAFGNVAANG
ncbi:chaplin [Streptomyces sp. NPDC004609]|uniref:chaplin n=1 Tax=Streptomyces sp. NPDC004609 TaxID=3364704 RepID=UPI0036C32BBE